jgi:hypothetical protein
MVAAGDPALAAGPGIREAGVNVYEVNTHPFVVKIWLEESAEEAGQATWRGYITHVPSGKRRYLQTLDDIIAFIVPYLEELGVEIPRG